MAANRRTPNRRHRGAALAWLSLIMAVALASCSGDSGSTGPAGPQGPEGPAPASTGTLTGTVTNSMTGSPISGLAVGLSPDVYGVTLTTDATGHFSSDLPIGVYTLSFEQANFASTTTSAGVVADQTTTVAIQLVPVARVIVSIQGAAAGNAPPGQKLNLTARVEVLDGSRVTRYQWNQTAGALATMPTTNAQTAAVTLAGPQAYKEELFQHLEAPDRFQVQGVNPNSLEEAGAVSFKVDVTTTSGTYSAETTVHADLNFAALNPGLANVPNDVPVLLHGKVQNAYNWSLQAPSGSTAKLDAPARQNPSFTPDISGTYVATERNSGATLRIYSGTWQGAITAQDANGLPLAGQCTGCHNGIYTVDNFTPWRQTGHAEIFSTNLNTSTHYGESCFLCHTVGYDTAGDNDGFDDDRDYPTFLKAGLLNHPSPSNWDTMLDDFPEVARRGNIQCENCHGPNFTTLHPNRILGDPERVSLSSDVCGMCHGEPLRHGRFQQWQLSKHANYETAIAEGTSSHCGRCHGGQGYLAWLPQLEAGNPGNIAAPITWTEDTVHPQTCAVCHDPHAEGNLSGEPNSATVRVTDSTPLLPSGFAALGVGRGAVCMTCHNTRNGAHNQNVADPSRYSAPHVAAQADVLMGENAYFVSVGDRSPHSYLEDTCATCHMELTPPPPDLSYNLSGTNHTFAASLTICAQCHGDFDGAALQRSFETQMVALQQKMGQAAHDKLNALGTIRVRAYDPVTDLYSSASSSDSNVTLNLVANPITHVEITEGHGQVEFHLTLTSPISITWTDGSTTRTNNFGVQLGSLLDNSSTAVYALSGNMLRAAWNYLLLEGDASKGVHNPGFSTNVIYKTMQQDLSF